MFYNICDFLPINECRDQNKFCKTMKHRDFAVTLHLQMPTKLCYNKVIPFNIYHVMWLLDTHIVQSTADRRERAFDLLIFLSFSFMTAVAS